MNSKFSSLSKIDAFKAIKLINLQIEKAEDLRVLAWNDSLRTQWCSTSRGLLEAGFHQIHDTVVNFDRTSALSYSPHESPQQRQKRRNKQLDRYLALMKSAIEQLEWILPADTQHLISSRSQHDAFQVIRKIIQSAKTEVYVVDNWVDESTWQLLTNVQASVAIQILTMQMKNDFTLEGKHFKAQHGNTVEVRKTEKVHDRFIILDKVTVWHLGPSIKDAGSKTAFMSEIHSPSVVAVTLNEINNLWSTSAPVAI
jgi:sugar-specific transcriptional regulator TrmB